MLTKTGSLLMRKKQQALHNTIPSNQIQNNHHNLKKDIKSSKSSLSHKSHMNQYHILFQTNRSKQNQANNNAFQIHKLLQVQNFRLIQQNMKIVEWSKTFLNGIKQNILQIIHTIQQFKYLEGVNKMYQLLSQINYYQETGLFSIKNVDIKEHYLYTFRNQNKNAQNKNKSSQLNKNKLDKHNYNNIQQAYSIKIPSQIRIKQFKHNQQLQDDEYNRQKNGRNEILWSQINVNKNIKNKGKKQNNQICHQNGQQLQQSSRIIYYKYNDFYAFFIPQQEQICQ